MVQVVPYRAKTGGTLCAKTLATYRAKFDIVCWTLASGAFLPAPRNFVYYASYTSITAAERVMARTSFEA